MVPSPLTSGVIPGDGGQPGEKSLPLRSVPLNSLSSTRRHAPGTPSGLGGAGAAADVEVVPVAPLEPVGPLAPVLPPADARVDGLPAGFNAPSRRRITRRRGWSRRERSRTVNVVPRTATWAESRVRRPTLPAIVCRATLPIRTATYPRRLGRVRSTTETS